jgi:hypothetical protein
VHFRKECGGEGMFQTRRLMRHAWREEFVASMGRYVGDEDESFSFETQGAWLGAR